jgi:hypothetical protein
LRKSIRPYTKAIVVWGFVFAVFSAGRVAAMAAPQGEQEGAVTSPSRSTFECVLPYVSSGGIVNIVSASGMDEVVEITVMNSYRYNIVVPKNSSYSFEAPMFKGIFVPIVDGGPISFKSTPPIAVSTVLTDSSVTVRCSELSQRTKLFVGSAKTRLALVNTTKSPMRVQFFQDNEQAPVSTLTIAAEDRNLAFLEELFPVSGSHAYRVVAGSDGFGLAVISGDKTAGWASPSVENVASK